MLKTEPGDLAVLLRHYAASPRHLEIAGLLWLRISSEGANGRGQAQEGLERLLTVEEVAV